MKTRSSQPFRGHAFTLLELTIVLAITALVLTAVYTLAQGTLTLSDDVLRAQRHDSRMQAFSSFCEHLFGEIPSNSTMNLSVTQERGQYLSQLNMEHVYSPFDKTTDCRVSLLTIAQPGGEVRLVINCQSYSNKAASISTVLLEDLIQCEWQVYHPVTKQWTSFWNERNTSLASTTQAHPALIKLVIKQADGKAKELTFWLAPNESVMQSAAPLDASKITPSVQR